MALVCGDRLYTSAYAGFLEEDDASKNDDICNLVVKRVMIKQKIFRNDLMTVVDNVLYAVVNDPSNVENRQTSIVAYDLSPEFDKFKLIYEFVIDPGRVVYLRFFKVFGDFIYWADEKPSKVYKLDRHSGNFIGGFNIPYYYRPSYLFHNNSLVHVGDHITVTNIVTGEEIMNIDLRMFDAKILTYNGYVYVFGVDDYLMGKRVNLCVIRIDISKKEYVIKNFDLWCDLNNGGERNAARIRRPESSGLQHVQIYKDNLFFLVGTFQRWLFAKPLSELMDVDNVGDSITTDIGFTVNWNVMHIWKDSIYIKNEQDVIVVYDIPRNLSEATWKDESVTKHEIAPPPNALRFMYMVRGNAYYSNNQLVTDYGTSVIIRLKLPRYRDSVLVPKDVETSTFDDAFIAFAETVSKTTDVFKNKFYQRLVTKFTKNDGYYDRMLHLANLVSDDTVRDSILDQVYEIHRMHLITVNSNILQSRIDSGAGSTESDVQNHTLVLPQVGSTRLTVQSVNTPQVVRQIAEFM